MIDREEFSSQLRAALDHLYDDSILRRYPLVWVVAGASGSSAPVAVQRLLMSAIQQLRPSAAAPHYSAQWRRYRHLWLRYVERLPPREVAAQLGVTERQARRDHLEGLETVAGALWARYCQIAPARLDPAATGSEAGDGSVGERELAGELEAIDSAAPGGQADLTEAAKSTLDTLARLAESQRVVVEAHLPDVLPVVAVDRVALRQVMLNVLVPTIEQNPASRIAIVAETPPGAVLLRIGVTPYARPGARSSGQPVLPASDDPALEALRRLLQAQGGALEIPADPRAGREIRVQLPVLGASTVLVIDDNPGFLRLFHRYLEGTPYRVISARSGEQALRLIGETRPSVVVLDVLLPSQDGWEVLQTLKREPGTRDIPVVICSVFDQPRLALSLGADEFLPKPLSRSALLSALRRHSAAPRPVCPDSPEDTAAPPPPRGRQGG